MKISADLLAAARVVAPTIASFIPGGPLAVGAFTALSNLVLGKPDGKPDEITAAIGSMTPEQIATVRAGDQAYAAKMAELDIEADKLIYDDRANARSTSVAFAQAKSLNEYGPLIVTVIILLLFSAVTLGWAAEPSLSGYDLLKTAVTILVSFWLGSSAGSRRKDDTVDKAATMLGNSTPAIAPADASTKQ